MKASTPELQSGSKDKFDILNAKVKEHCCHRQVKREEKQCREKVERRACKEVEARASEEVEQVKVKAECKAREEVECQVQEQVEKDRAEVQWKAAEVTARQRALVQEVLKKRMREELGTGPVGEVQ